jgi:hypothetical protein
LRVTEPKEEQVSLDHAELGTLLVKDVDELYVLLAQSDPANADTMFSADEARKQGRRTFERMWGPLRQRICIEWRYCEKKAAGLFADTLTLTAAIADIIVTIVGGIPAGTVAALVVKLGVHRLCECKE